MTMTIESEGETWTFSETYTTGNMVSSVDDDDEAEKTVACAAAAGGWTMPFWLKTATW